MWRLLPEDERAFQELDLGPWQTPRSRSLRGIDVGWEREVLLQESHLSSNKPGLHEVLQRIPLFASVDPSVLEMLQRAAVLAKHGYGVLLYDERASGESDGDKHTFGWLDVNDVPLALDYLQTRSEIDPQRIGILGFSIGGQIALRAAAQSDQLKAVIAEEPGFARISDVPDVPTLEDKFYVASYWLGEKWISLRTGVPIPEGVLDGLPRIAPRPVLFIATGRDYGRTLVRFFYDRAGEPKQWWEVPETAHGGSPQVRPAEYENTIVRFLDRALAK